jgi:hypothetical protein
MIYCCGRFEAGNTPIFKAFDVCFSVAYCVPISFCQTFLADVVYDDKK